MTFQNTLGVAEGSEKSGGSMNSSLSNLGRKLGKTSSQQRKKMFKQSSQMGSSQGPRASFAGGNPDGFKSIKFMNRSNTALGDMFNKKYLEPEVYGKSKENFMKGGGTGLSSSQTSLNSQGQVKAGTVTALNRKQTVSEFQNEAEKEASEKIKLMIEKRRSRKIADAKIEQEKSEQIQKSLEFMQQHGRKMGGNAMKNMRGITEPDFFQKYITAEKGLTFNYEGALIDYKMPKHTKAVAEKMDYQVNEQVETIQQAVSLKNFKKQQTKGANLFSQSVSFDGTEKTVTRKDTDNLEATRDFEGERNFGQGGKSGVIESNYVAPTKVMSIQPGVELTEKGKVTKGDKMKVQNKLNLSDYRKLKEPREQQAVNNMRAFDQRRSDSQNALEANNEDPYRSFKRALLYQQKVDKESRASARNKSKASHRTHGSSERDLIDNQINVSISNNQSSMQLVKPYQSMQKVNRNQIHGAGSKEADRYIEDLAAGQDNVRTQ